MYYNIISCFICLWQRQRKLRKIKLDYFRIVYPTLDYVMNMFYYT